MLASVFRLIGEIRAKHPNARVGDEFKGYTSR